MPGVAHAVSIFHNPAAGGGDSTAEALDVVSTNPLDTTVGVRGQEEGRGTVKITHQKPANPDPNAAALSLALEGAGTAAQGIFIGNDAGNVTTGHLLNLRNGGPGTERLILTADGQLQLAIQGPGGGLLMGTDANLYRAAPATLGTDGALLAHDLRPQRRHQPGADLRQGPQAGGRVDGRKQHPVHDDPARQPRPVPRRRDADHRHHRSIGEDA